MIETNKPLILTLTNTFKSSISHLTDEFAFQFKGHTLDDDMIASIKDIYSSLLDAYVSKVIDNIK